MKMTVSEIVDKSGGPVAIAREASDMGRKRISPAAVYKWIEREDGIPEVHWPVIMRLAGGRVTPSVLHAANEHQRREMGKLH